MTAPTPESFYTFADQLLYLANTEMQHPEDEVITHLVCSHSRQSIINYLTGYLLSQDTLPAEPLSPERLLEQCKELDDRFMHLDLTPIHCRFDTDNDAYCRDVKKVEECLHLALATGNLVRPHGQSEDDIGI